LSINFNGNKSPGILFGYLSLLAFQRKKKKKK